MKKQPAEEAVSSIHWWQKIKTTDKKIVLGRYIVADPRICHGKLTFRGTRIFVADVLEQVAEGLVCETIMEEWGGAITKEAIAEAVQLASQHDLEGFTRNLSALGVTQAGIKASVTCSHEYPPAKRR